MTAVMAAQYPMRPGEADCRDFLRTGRCKYGESCKYHHPLNVDCGGGVRPVNPGEPLFPIRPTEPPCQYFLKHGTCKFGQSCKFNHPRGAALADVSGGMPAGQLVFVTANTGPGSMSGGDASSHHIQASTSVQVLPQRPTEPNCIYFLRNGKCKYGGTCKFHHPLDAINRNNQVHQLQPNNNLRPPQNIRDRSGSFGSMSDGRAQMQQQHNVTYTPAPNLSYVQQAQRLQPITERVRTQQQATHILLPDGQIAVILDPQSLQQQVGDMSNTQDRPKFYLSQADGSIGTLPSMDQNSSNPVGISPMLTATTNSTSNNTFDSSIDLNVSYQGQTLGTLYRGPQKFGSGGSLSAHGSLDSGSITHQGDYSHQVMGHMQSQPLSSSLPSLTQSSLPQYSWPMNEGIEQSNQAQRRMSPGIHDTLGQRLGSTAEDSPAAYWPTNGSFSSIPMNERDNAQARRPYGSMPNASPYGSSNAVGQPVHRSYSSERNSPIPQSASSDRVGGRHPSQRQSQENSGDDCEGLTMMTSALLTMMDRHESPSMSNQNQAASPSPNRSSLAMAASRNANQQANVYYSQSEPNLQERAHTMRPPPGMMNLPGLSHVEPGYPTSNFNQEIGSNFFVGGYDQMSRSPPSWGD